MDSIIYLLGRTLIGLIQALPLRLVAILGRIGGFLVYLLDVRHRRVALKNVSRCFPDKSPSEVRALVRENFCRIGESYTCGIKTASMSDHELRKHLEFTGPEYLTQPQEGGPTRSAVIAIGHFGNFELYVHFAQFCPGYRSIATYRGMPQPSINKLMKNLRNKSECTFYDRRYDNAKLKEAMNTPGVMLGLLCDQCGGDRGLQLPFFGKNASTSPATAIYALRYDCLLFPAICYRTGLGKWRIECGDSIPTKTDEGKNRSSEDIMRDVNAAIEAGVRKDPANWFWVHNRWKRSRPTSETA